MLTVHWSCHGVHLRLLSWSRSLFLVAASSNSIWQKGIDQFSPPSGSLSSISHLNEWYYLVPIFPSHKRECGHWFIHLPKFPSLVPLLIHLLVLSPPLLLLPWFQPKFLAQIFISMLTFCNPFLMVQWMIFLKSTNLHSSVWNCSMLSHCSYNTCPWLIKNHYSLAPACLSVFLLTYSCSHSQHSSRWNSLNTQCFLLPWTILPTYLLPKEPLPLPTRSCLTLCLTACSSVFRFHFNFLSHPEGFNEQQVQIKHISLFHWCYLFIFPVRFIKSCCFFII